MIIVESCMYIATPKKDTTAKSFWNAGEWMLHFGGYYTLTIYWFYEKTAGIPSSEPAPKKKIIGAFFAEPVRAFWKAWSWRRTKFIQCRGVHMEISELLLTHDSNLGESLDILQCVTVVVINALIIWKKKHRLLKWDHEQNIIIPNNGPTHSGTN